MQELKIGNFSFSIHKDISTPKIVNTLRSKDGIFFFYLYFDLIMLQEIYENLYTLCIVGQQQQQKKKEKKKKRKKRKTEEPYKF